jgi:hypothetical protein
LGNTVEVLKSFVESDYGIPMSKQVCDLGLIFFSSIHFWLGQHHSFVYLFWLYLFHRINRTQRLFLDDQPMMDPLSLLDYPEAKGADELFVRVEGPMPSSSKK